MRHTSSLDDGRIAFDRRLAQTMARDLVCGELVDPRDSVTATYAGHVYYFHSVECQRAFERDPTRYSTQASPGARSG